MTAAVALRHHKRTTQEKYASVLRSYHYFCAEFDFQPYPAEELTLATFAFWLSDHVSAASIRGYLRAVRSYHVELEIDIKPIREMPRLQQVLGGLERDDAAFKKQRLRLPITVEALHALIEAACPKAADAAAKEAGIAIWDFKHPAFRRCVWQLAFFGALRPEEFCTVMKQDGPTREALRFDQVKRACQNGKEYLTLSLLQRKNAQHGGPLCKVTIGATEHEVLCGVTAFDDYFAARRAAGETIFADSLLFPCWNAVLGKYEELRYTTALEWLRKDLSKAELPAELFGLHSFRIGAVTSAALNGESEYWLILLGGWSAKTRMHLHYARLAHAASDVERAMRSINLIQPRMPMQGDPDLLGFWAQARRSALASMEGDAQASPAQSTQSSSRNGHARTETVAARGMRAPSSRAQRAPSK